MTLAVTSTELALVFIELGAMFLGLALLARLSHKLGFSPVPFYLLAGLAFGEGGLVPFGLSRDFVELAAEIGVVLLLFALGLEYAPRELRNGLRRNSPAGIVDLVLNALPGLAIGLLLGWNVASAVLLAGVTYISSSGIISKVLDDLGRLGNRETPIVLSILVIEDLAMAVYLPIVGVIAAGDTPETAAITLSVALATVAVVLYVAMRHGRALSRALETPSDEALLLSVLGVTLLVAGGAQALRVSAAVGAFLVGLAISDRLKMQVRALVHPLRDLFAASFFVLFGLQINPAALPAALPIALVLAVVTGVTKYVTGWWAAKREGLSTRGRRRAGATLIARGEFSIVIAGFGIAAPAAAGIAGDLGAVTASYVLLLAIIGPILARLAEPRRRPALQI